MYSPLPHLLFYLSDQLSLKLRSVYPFKTNGVHKYRNSINLEILLSANQHCWRISYVREANAGTRKSGSVGSDVVKTTTKHRSPVTICFNVTKFTNFFKQLVTADDTWVTYDNIIIVVEPDQASVWWDRNGIISGMLPYGQTINSIHWQKLTGLKQAIEEKRIELVKEAYCFTKTTQGRIYSCAFLG